MLLCVGPEGSGKTLLLCRLQADHKAALTATDSTGSSVNTNVPAGHTVPTTGVDIVSLEKLHEDKNKSNLKLTIRELGKLSCLFFSNILNFLAVT